MSPLANGDAAVPIAPEIVQQAVAWMIRLESGTVDPRQEQRCAQWRQAHPHHELAWRRLQFLDHRVSSLSGAVPATLAREALDRPKARGPGRRAFMLYIATAAGLGAWVLREPMGIPAVLADHRTGTGERRRITLPDGSRVDLNADSAMDVAFDAGMRLLILRRGDMVITTGPDTGQAVHRPLTVRTSHGDMLALGTRYMVRRRDDATHIAVYEGAVRVRPQIAGGIGTLLPAGSQTHFDVATVAPLEAIHADDDAWTDGLLVARQMRLVDFVAELSRYRAGWITCDPAVADLRVSGVYPLDDSFRALSALPDTLPVRLSMRTRYWVAITPK